VVPFGFGNVRGYGIGISTTEVRALADGQAVES